MLEQRLMDIREFQWVYEKQMKHHFPADEIKPFDIVENAFYEGNYLPYGYYEKDTLVAYTFFLKCGNYLLLDYFAVLEIVRGQGRGSEILSVIKSHLTETETIFLEVEKPEADEEENRNLQERRIRFYLRNGAEFTNVQADVFHVSYLVLTMGRPCHGEKAENAMKILYHSILTDQIYEKNVFFKLDNEK